MRRIIFLLLIIVPFVANAQYKFGVMGGGGVSSFVGEDFPPKYEQKTGLMFGGFYEREINLTLSWGFELTYEQKGAYYEELRSIETILRVDNRMSYISLPFMVKAYFGRTAVFYIYAGVNGSRKINSSSSHSFTHYGYPISSLRFEEKINNWDAAALVGIGFNVQEIILDIRYHHGLANVYEGKTSPSFRNHFLTATLGFSIFKKKDISCFNDRRM